MSSTAFRLNSDNGASYDAFRMNHHHHQHKSSDDATESDSDDGAPLLVPIKPLSAVESTTAAAPKTGLIPIATYLENLASQAADPVSTPANSKPQVSMGMSASRNLIPFHEYLASREVAKTVDTSAKKNTVIIPIGEYFANLEAGKYKKTPMSSPNLQSASIADYDTTSFDKTQHADQDDPEVRLSQRQSLGVKSPGTLQQPYYAKHRKTEDRNQVIQRSWIDEMMFPDEMPSPSATAPELPKRFSSVNEPGDGKKRFPAPVKTTQRAEDSQSALVPASLQDRIAKEAMGLPEEHRPVFQRFFDDRGVAASLRAAQGDNVALEGIFSAIKKRVKKVMADRKAKKTQKKLAKESKEDTTVSTATVLPRNEEAGSNPHGSEWLASRERLAERTTTTRSASPLTTPGMAARLQQSATAEKPTAATYDKNIVKDLFNAGKRLLGKSDKAIVMQLFDGANKDSSAGASLLGLIHAAPGALLSESRPAGMSVGAPEDVRGHLGLARMDGSTEWLIKDRRFAARTLSPMAGGSGGDSAIKRVVEIDMQAMQTTMLKRKDLLDSTSVKGRVMGRAFVFWFGKEDSATCKVLLDTDANDTSALTESVWYAYDSKGSRIIAMSFGAGRGRSAAAPGVMDVPVRAVYYAHIRKGAKDAVAGLASLIGDAASSPAKHLMAEKAFVHLAHERAVGKASVMAMCATNHALAVALGRYVMPRVSSAHVDTDGVLLPDQTTGKAHGVELPVEALAHTARSLMTNLGLLHSSPAAFAVGTTVLGAMLATELDEATGLNPVTTAQVMSQFLHANVGRVINLADGAERVSRLWSTARTDTALALQDFE